MNRTRNKIGEIHFFKPNQDGIFKKQIHYSDWKDYEQKIKGIKVISFRLIK